MLSLIAIAVAFISLSHAIEDPEYAFHFGKFVSKFNKTYNHGETEYRFGVFKKNFDGIVAHNQQNLPWTLDVNEFADLTQEEFFSTRLGFQPLIKNTARRTVNLAGLVTVPRSIDWTTKGAVSEVKNQGQCGSCWAFSTTGSIEGAVAIKTGELKSLSEQQLVDCSSAEGNQGCNGGLMDDGFEYVIKNNGICSESSYPYTASDGSCHQCSAVSQIKSFVDVESNNLDALEAAVAQQPVSVAIEADQFGFQFYSGGVFSGNCGTQLDHGVLVVGYGTEDGKDYWKVKNSWGGSWGEQGYIKMIKHSGHGSGQCGIAVQPSYPIA